MSIAKAGWVSLWLALAAAWPAQGQASEPAGQKAPPIECAEGLERYLPGDYYLCAASRAVARGRYASAISLYESAAAWGDKRAQFNLGLLYYRGQHVPQDKARGMAWLALSAERPQDRLQREVLASAYASASPELRRQADALWNAMKPRYADRTARTRALNRFARSTRELRRSAMFSPFDTVWIEGLGRMQIDTVMETLNAGVEGSLGRPTVTVGAPSTIPDRP
jgi:hypothetical protein